MFIRGYYAVTQFHAISHVPRAGSLPERSAARRYRTCTSDRIPKEGVPVARSFKTHSQKLDDLKTYSGGTRVKVASGETAISESSITSLVKDILDAEPELLDTITIFLLKFEVEKLEI